MKRVKVHVFEEIRARLGQKAVLAELDDAAVLADLFPALGEQVDPLFHELGETEASTYAAPVLLLNGRRLERERDAAQPLHDGDELYLIPVISGGAASLGRGEKLLSARLRAVPTPRGRSLPPAE